jgi:UDPglucose 6-dehydrogenase
MKSIGIVGQGFVGTAVFEGLKHAFRVIAYDKAKPDGMRISDQGFVSPSAGQILKTPYENLVSSVDNCIFVCVPTPMNPDGSCNVLIVEGVVQEIAKAAEQLGKQGVVAIIKSTVVPGTTLRLNNTYKNIQVVFNPEFLRERSSLDDFKTQDRIIIGGPHEGTTLVKQLYETAFPNVPVTKTSSTIAEMVKYMTNCFLATKVSFANEMAKICGKLEVDYDKVVEYATKDKRLGTSHWSVPGPDGQKGFGGSCFPKDLNAMLRLAESMGVDVSTMQGAWETNLEVRPEKDWEQLKGRAVSE